MENIILKDKGFQDALSILEQIIKKRITAFFNGESMIGSFDFSQLNGLFSHENDQLPKLELKDEEKFILLIALAPHIQPHFFDQVIQNNIPQAGDFPQLGGVRGKNFRGFLPTGETVLFILAGNNFKEKIEIQQYFSEDHFFAKNRILWLEEPPIGEPRMSGRIVLSQEYIDLFTSGKISRPKFGLNFPAQLIETQMEWEDLVLRKETLQNIQELQTFVNHGATLMKEWGMSKKLKPGYRVLFHGHPGTGKTLTASLLGKYTGKEVYKIDLSMVVSKFIGETEKNLSSLFAKAENKDWILFFDEADALFGKRTNVKDAHDKYANQEVSYLLQRVENYNGLVILASNFKSNMDDAFVRRFQSIIQFHMPDKKERLQLWKKGFPSNIQFASDVELGNIASKYDLSGASIMNVIQYCCLSALEKNTNVISLSVIITGIRREFSKEGRVLR